MDQIGIVKRAWQITWRYKALWILGFFAGGVGANSGGSSRSYSTSDRFGGSGTGGAEEMQRFWGQVQQYLPILVIVGMIVLFVLLIFWAISIAARAGLIWAANEAAEGRDVRAGQGWSAGFHYWGRTFLISLLLGLPVLVIVVFIGAMVASALVPVIRTLAATGDLPQQAMGALFGVCGILGVGFLILIPLSIVLGLLQQLALRRAVLDDLLTMDAIRTGWSDLRARAKDVVVMALLLWAIFIAYGIAVGIVSAVFALPAVAAGMGGAAPIAAFLGFLLFLVLIVPTAIANTFNSTAWTVFFRRMTGREVAAPPASAYAGGYPPPPPGYAPQPPAPPAPSAPPSNEPAPGDAPPPPQE